jgi:hypothetical protein
MARFSLSLDPLQSGKLAHDRGVAITPPGVANP